MDSFARLAPDERAEALGETAARRGIAAALIVEKDFWVCWTLKRLFGLTDVGADMIFKGGTSLSKAYGAIERFSEDIDISIDRKALGFAGDRDPSAPGVGSNARKALLDELQTTVASHVTDTLLPRLREAVATQLEADTWSVEPSADDPQTLNFTYPPSLTETDYANLGYVSPQVRIEFGGRSDHWPAEDARIVPYVAEEFPDLFAAPECTVKTLSAERTFWEKATILHAEHHRPAGKALGERISRHYYDLAMLARSPVRARALEQIELLEAVANHKTHFFRAAWAKYDEARPGSLRLLPSEDLRSALQADYAKMGEMIFGEPPSFDSVLETLAGLEAEINTLS